MAGNPARLAPMVKTSSMYMSVTDLESSLRTNAVLGAEGPAMTSTRGTESVPWAMAATARIRDEAGIDVEALWSDDGFVIRYPDGDRLPDTSLLLPDPDEVERLVVRQLGSTAMFSARFREAAGRALLLPRRRPGARAPLWQLRKRASDLLAVAARFGSFPIILETYRECLRDIFDLPALTDIMSGNVQLFIDPAFALLPTARDGTREIGRAHV